MKTKGTIIWDSENGWASPELELPPTEQVVVFIDYPDDDLSMPLAEPEIEELLSSLGYAGEGRYLGENDPLNPLKTKTVTYVGAFPIEELSRHLSILSQTNIPQDWFYTLRADGKISQIHSEVTKATQETMPIGSVTV